MGRADAAPCACSGTLDDLLSSRSKPERPVCLDSRSAVTCFKYGERATHSIHPYPAKLLPQIPHLLLSSHALAPPGSNIVDPFCGSGTVLLEAAAAGHRSAGTDVNPLAVLISQVKTTPIDPQRLRRAALRLSNRIDRGLRSERPDVVNLGHWYSRRAVDQLRVVREAIDRTRDEDLRAFFEISFSVCTRRVSRADPRVSVPVRLKKNHYPEGHPLHSRTAARLKPGRRLDVFGTFSRSLDANIRRMENLWNEFPALPRATILGGDARRLMQSLSSDLPLADGWADLVLTSPPYGGAQKYIRASSLSLGWLRLCHPAALSELERASIGREHFRKADLLELPKTGHRALDRRLRAVRRDDNLRAILFATYLIEMRQAISEAWRILRDSGHLVLVSGDNELRGSHLPTSRILRDLAKDIGFDVRLVLRDRIRSRGLLTKRHAAASVIAEEQITIFRKPA